jgi:hypothetical protein
MMGVPTFGSSSKMIDHLPPEDSLFRRLKGESRIGGGSNGKQKFAEKGGWVNRFVDKYNMKK